MAHERDGQRGDERKEEGVVWVCGRLGRSGRLDFAGQRERAAKSGSGKGTRQRPNLRAWATKGPEGETKSNPSSEAHRATGPREGALTGPRTPHKSKGGKEKRKRGRGEERKRRRSCINSKCKHERTCENTRGRANEHKQATRKAATLL
ncbi:hypothetical protein C8R47DRAFT_1071114 [Mycena vitilis]|nr:hypothetical protein C8R47DRAFT_1071114 [Mycena vitilis]